tara:strand:- start:6 stop:983 length:978 start_codon:yes stop_codon:yes gene_type:complete
MDDPLKSIRRAVPVAPDKGFPTTQQLLETYVSVKGKGRDELFARTAKRNISYLEGCLGQRSINQYSTADAATFRDWLFGRQLSNASVLRITGALKAMFNFIINEQGLSCNNPFAKVYISSDILSEKRKAIPPNSMTKLQTSCRALDDDLRWLVAMISDTGMRLSEAVGLRQEDLHLDNVIPYLEIAPHASRRLKTASSKRVIPLVGEALWAAQKVDGVGQSFCFPRYCNETTCKSNSASAAINKWLKTVIGNAYVIHGLRHSFRDRLRNVGAPTDLIDQLGGWSLKTVGQGYGDGYSLELCGLWMGKLVEKPCPPPNSENCETDQ